MPYYDFLNTETGEQWSDLMSISSKEKFLEENPHIKQQILTAPQLARGTSTTSFRNDDGWNENLARIAEAHPNSTLANKVKGGRTSKQVLIDKAKEKANLKKKDYKMDL